MAGKRSGGGSKFTDVARDKILSAIRMGNFREIAAQWAGIDKGTLSKWMQRPEPEYQDFARQVLEAEVEAEVNCVQAILQSVEKNPEHAKWYLERKAPERWGKRDGEYLIKRELMEIEKKVLGEKLKMLEAGEDPDRQSITVVIPQLTPEERLEAEAAQKDVEGIDRRRR